MTEALTGTNTTWPQICSNDSRRRWLSSVRSPAPRPPRWWSSFPGASATGGARSRSGGPTAALDLHLPARPVTVEEAVAVLMTGPGGVRHKDHLGYTV